MTDPITRAEAADIAGLGRTTILQARKDGELHAVLLPLPGQRCTKTYYFERAEVLAWAKTVKARPKARHNRRPLHQQVTRSTRNRLPGFNDDDNRTDNSYQAVLDGVCDGILRRHTGDGLRFIGDRVVGGVDWGRLDTTGRTDMMMA